MALRKGSRLGKYRIMGRIGGGGFADVYRAMDTVEGVKVALKVPLKGLSSGQALESFQREVRLHAKLEHPSILAIKNADVFDGQLVVAYPLGEGALSDRLQRRMSVERTLDYARQIYDALAYSHTHRIIHCDVKPENLILFPGNRIRLTDFGISKIARRTVVSAGSGTLGYMAPEQAMGRPSFRSDVFSAALIQYRMLSGRLPEWPFEWPLTGHDRLKRKVSPSLIEFLRRCLRVNHRKRYATAVEMAQAYRRLLPGVRGWITRRKRRSR